MTTEDKDRKKLSLSRGGTLSLGKTVETSQVRQSFSHGRSKTVQVERRRKRLPVVNNENKDSDNEHMKDVEGDIPFEDNDVSPLHDDSEKNDIES